MTLQPAESSTGGRGRAVVPRTVTTSRATRAAALVFAATVVAAIASFYFVVTLPVAEGNDLSGRAAAAPYVIGMLLLALPGLVLVRQQPRSTIGWLLLLTGFAGVLARAALGLAWSASVHGLPGAVLTGWLTNWIWVPGQLLALVLLLRFPGGQLPSRRWVWPERLVLLWGGTTVLATAVVPGPLGAEVLAPATNPVGIGASDGLVQQLLGVCFLVLPGVVILAVAAPVSRWRTAPPDTRRQLRWVALAALVVGLTAPLAVVSDAGALLEGVAYLALPGAIGYAAVRHRLWDLDVRDRFDRLRRVREEERRRLRRELHDSLGPLLGSISMRAETVRNVLAQEGPSDRLDSILAAIGEASETAMVEVRRIIDELGPSALAETDLRGALTGVVEGYRASASADAPSMHLDVPPRLPQLDPAAEEVAYWIVAEALRNAVRHAAAHRLETVVRLDETEGELIAVVSDDGRGLCGHPPGVGRRTMVERAASVGGTVAVTDAPGGGVEVRLRLPGAMA